MIDTVFIADSWTYGVNWVAITFIAIAISIGAVRVAYWKAVAKHPGVADEKTSRSFIGLQNTCGGCCEGSLG